MKKNYLNQNVKHKKSNVKLFNNNNNSLSTNIVKFQKIALWIRKIWFSEIPEDMVIKQITIFNRHLQCRGPKDTIKRIKFLRLCLSRHLAGNDIPKEPFMKYNGALPKQLVFASQIQKRDINSIRLTYTLLEFSKLIPWWDKPDYSSIVHPTKYNGNIGFELGRIYKKLNGLDLNVVHQEYHYSVKAGPIGRALASSFEEVKRLSPSLLSNIRLLGGDSLASKIDKVRELSLKVPSSTMARKYFKENINSLRKISFVRAHEGKLRPIAIFDYWSQSSLKPLHDRVFQSLKGFSQDCTFNQNHAKFSNENYCFDLTAATDRFPLKIQEDFLSTCIGWERARAWSQILTQEEFDTPEGDQIKYNAGQPMGAYSSWAVFALCHHLIVQYAAERCNKSLPFRSYYLLGDDIVIQDAHVAAEYEKLLNIIDVEISKTKSIESKIFMEFAKRYWYNGIEVTPFHICAIVSTYKSWIDLFSYVSTMHLRGWEIPFSMRYMYLKDLLVCCGLPRSYASRSTDNILLLHDIQSIIEEFPYNSGLGTQIMSKFFLDFGCNRGNYARELLLEVIVNLKLQVMQESLISTVKEINKVVKDFTKFLKEYCDTNDNTYFKDIPLIYILITRSNNLMNEHRSMENILQTSGVFELLKLDWEILPDPVRVISKKSVDREKSVPSRAIINKLKSFLINERKLYLAETDSS